jgi:hypothetical protein
MVLDRSKKLLFVHIPKTGGTTIENLMDIPLEKENFYGVVNSLALQHYTAEKLRLELGKEYFDECYKFAIVRNPYERMISEYFFLPRRRTFKQFLEFVRDIVHKKKYDTNLFYDHFKPQYEFVYIDGELVVNSIGRFENFSEYVDQLIVDHNLNKEKFGHLGKGKYDKTVDYFEDPYCRQIINEIYQKDFEYFGYEMRI